MPSRYLHLRAQLDEAGLLPSSKLAFITLYLLALDVLLFALQKVFGWFKLSYGDSLGGWVTFLAFVFIILLAVLATRWVRAKLLWRLRNRLIVTWVFIGVIPSILLVALTLGSFYLFAGQFATFIVTTGLESQLQTLDAANSAIAYEVGARTQRGEPAEVAAFESLRRTHRGWQERQVCVWLDKKIILSNLPSVDSTPPLLPDYLKSSFRAVVRDHDELFLRSVETMPVRGQLLTVISSEPFDQNRLQELAENLGVVSLYPSGTDAHTTPLYAAGAVPPPTRNLDRQVVFATSVKVVDWSTGNPSRDAALAVQTRYSKLGERLFSASGDFASVAELILFLLLIVFAIIELTALLIGTRFTRTVTGTVAQLYDATKHINRGDFGHRIPVKSNDQMAALANSFNSMTASLERLFKEQEEKQSSKTNW